MLGFLILLVILHNLSIKYLISKISHICYFFLNGSHYRCPRRCFTWSYILLIILMHNNFIISLLISKIRCSVKGTIDWVFSVNCLFFQFNLWVFEKTNQVFFRKIQRINLVNPNHTKTEYQPLHKGVVYPQLFKWMSAKNGDDP